MPKRLELIREEKLFRLVPGMNKGSRLEASGVALIDDSTALVVFDNINKIARIDLSLEYRDSNRLFDSPSPGTGFEDIAIDVEGQRVLCIIEAKKDVDGIYRGFISEYDSSGNFIRCSSLATDFQSKNKGFEGLAFARREGKEYLFALCEGNLGTDAKRGGGRVDVFIRTESGNWAPSHSIHLPKSAEFEDYAAISYRNGQVAVISQADALLWTARLDACHRMLVPESEVIYRFPGKDYGTVEGIAWLSEDTLVAVSDKKKGSHPKRFANTDESIHIFRIVWWSHEPFH